MFLSDSSKKFKGKKSKFSKNQNKIYMNCGRQLQNLCFTCWECLKLIVFFPLLLRFYCCSEDIALPTISGRELLQDPLEFGPALTGVLHPAGHHASHVPQLLRQSSDPMVCPLVSGGAERRGSQSHRILPLLLQILLLPGHHIHNKMGEAATNLWRGHETSWWG